MSKNEEVKLCKIEFFNNNKSLGTFDLIEKSSELHRRLVAIEHDVKNWTHYVLDQGRIFVVRLSKDYVLFCQGEPTVLKIDKLTSDL